VPEDIVHYVEEVKSDKRTEEVVATNGVELQFLLSLFYLPMERAEKRNNKKDLEVRNDKRAKGVDKTV